ncbi:dipeptidyl peptidase 4 [Chanos chanos]|uniref:Dipeptidyl peptidase 4 n=1 Tax=Chanos chanos TaxID=29144 RepID=A0A6J2V2K1_CHACN|nr:dipeptidyl peptidase 4-like [Chanos chanos]
MGATGVGKVLLALLGIAVVVTLIAVPTAIFLNDDKKETVQRTYTLDDYFNSSIRTRSYSVRWVSDKEYLHKTREGTVYLHNVETGNSSEFLSRSKFDQVRAFDYLVSADRMFTCFMSNYTKLWRHSFLASYSIYDHAMSGFINTDIPHEVQYLAWAPVGNRLAFVWENNVYVKTSPTSQRQQVTHNGQHNQILNGVPDWVYEEEMFSTNYALWWSPGGRYIAYAEFNDSQVHTIEYSWYGGDQYPQTVLIPYPKPGTPNPTVRLFVVDATNVSSITEVVVPSSVGAGEHYLSTVTWVTDDRIAVQWQRRTQSSVTLQIYERSGNTWRESSKLDQTSKTGWVGRFSPSDPVFAKDGQSFYHIMSDSNGFKHIHHVTDGRATPITTGNWEVISILKVTQDALFYVSNEHNSQPGQRNVYKVAIQGSTYSSPVCLTCTLMEERCKYNSASFSHDATYYIMACYGPGLPFYSLRSHSGADSEIKVLEENEHLENILKDFAMPSVIHKTMKIGEFDLWYQMTLPPGFDKNKKYPLLIDVYAGPCSQKSDFRYRLNWATYLASTEKIIVASFDGRGSGYQGDKIMHSIYKQLGTYEVEDQITAARHFIDEGFIDKERVAIWGWSYGGYVTSMVLGAGSGVFKCGMAVAPVSKWEYYDTIYTERYMLQPSENRESYLSSTVTGRAKNFASVQYLLVHGTADDNVHFQQAAQISKALVDEQVDFEAMWYTDEDHGLGGSANQHVYTHMSHFLLKCFA